MVDFAKAPVAKVVPKTTTLHGDTLNDPYAWLRDRESAEVIAYLEAENAYTEAVMADTKDLQDALYAEMLGRIKQTDLSVPYRKGDYWYYARTTEGRQYPIYCRSRELGSEGGEQILIDANAMAAGHDYFRIGVLAVSPNQNLLAYSTDVEGDEEYTLRVKDLRTGELLPTEIKRTYNTVRWAADNETLFYNVLDAAKRPYRVYRHRLGSTTPDVLVYEETDERFTLEVNETRDEAYLLLDSHSSTTSEVRLLRATDPEGEFEVLLPRVQDIEYAVEHHTNRFYVTINDTGRNFRLVTMAEADRSRERWRELIAHSADVLIEAVEPFADHVVIVQRSGGLRQLRIDTLGTGESHLVIFPEAAYTVYPVMNVEFRTNLLRFSYESFTTPASVFDYNMDTRERELKKQEEVLGGYDRTAYETERLFATAADGKQIPMALVYKRGMVRDGRNPTLLYGYGAYGINTEARFSSSRVSLLDRGFVYAIAQTRGGSDLGRPWHDDGKMLNKRNTFSDFIRCAEELIAQKITDSDHLAIEGGSAGGLLMGAVVTERPELFQAVLAHVPFVDVVNTMLDTSLPLTVGEFEEWGNPQEDRYYRYIRSYSPYDNTRPASYPHMLVTAGLNDPRVSYWEPAKWVARLRALKQDRNILLLKTNMGAGHFGASGRYDRLKEIAFEYSFLLKAVQTPKQP
ncbi:MAG: S9 family peptidase [Bryobacterales bacterium]|nr:S9 family peptidase [Bryobacterales bacterium]